MDTQKKKRLAAHNLAEAQSEGNLPFVSHSKCFFYVSVCAQNIFGHSAEMPSLREKRKRGNKTKHFVI